MNCGPDQVDYSISIKLLRLDLALQFGARPPLPVQLKRDYARYTSSYEIEGSTLVGDRTMEVTVHELPAERRNDFLAFRGAVFADVEQQVAVKVGGETGTGAITSVDSDDLLEAARAAQASGDFKTAIELIERVLKAEPGHTSAYGDLGRAYVGLLRLDEAETALKKAIDLNPFSPDAHGTLGQVYWMQERYAEAEKQFRRQIEIVPLDPWSHAGLGELLLDRKKYAEAAPVLEKAAAISPDDARLHMLLGSAQISLGKTEKALESFDRAVEIAPSPPVWNNIAFTLAEHGASLDRAQLYSESAISTLTIQLRNVRLDRLRPEDLVNVRLLGACWDTLGWVHFLKGRTSNALRYLSAAWELSQDGAVADHMGQLHEREGKRDLAIEYFALAVAEPGDRAGSRKRLSALVGTDKVERYVNEQRSRLGLLRTYDVPGAAGDGTADFFVALTPGPRVAEVRFVSGDPRLKSQAALLKSIRFRLGFPDEGDARVVRRGILSCEASGGKPGVGSCAFILMNPEDVRSVN